jgi:hypothetical protein
MEPRRVTRADPRVSRFARRFVAIVPLACLPWSMAWAYTAAGDRIFPATLLLPQIAPSDELYITGSTQPGRGTRTSNLSVLFDKTITERLGVAVTGGYNRIDNAPASDGNGWLDPDFILQYEAILDPAHEFVLSAGVDRQFGGVGTGQAGADPVGATTPMVYFGKGFGDIAPDWLKPLAVSGFAGYQLADSSARSDQVTGGLAFGYSMPYRESKIASDTLPALLRNTTPMVEMLAATPNHGGSTTLTIAPGIAYAGQGWEFAVEALVPATEATGDGAGVIAQFHFGLDYLFPDSLGAPLIAGE